jgi:glycosyltransferase involved in cell wall biosynthesis
MKFYRIKNVVCNSEFTKSIIDREYGLNSQVIYPPISVNDFRPRRKKNLVVYIGRFSSLAQHKGQDTLIRVFKKFYKKNKEWKLVLAGGAEVGDDMSGTLSKMASGYPIEILKSPVHKVVKELLGEAKMFWSASGYGIDENLEPEKVEHFGITVVEAMAAKAIPLVVAKGGHKEIVEHNINGYLWSKKRELLSYAQEIADNFGITRELSNNAHEKAQKYSEDRFIEQFTGLID